MSIQFQNWLTVQEACTLLGVSNVTLNVWRGRGLPTILIPAARRPAVRFDLPLVLAWAKKNNKTINIEFLNQKRQMVKTA